MNWRAMGIGRMVEALQSRNFIVDQVQVYGIMQGDPQYVFVLAGSNEGVEVTLPERVASNSPQKDGNLLCSCRGLTRATQNQGLRYLDLVPVVFHSEDGGGYVGDVSAACWTELNDGGQLGILEMEQSQRRKRGGLEAQPFGDCWNQQVVRRRYTEAAKELKGGLKRRTEAFVVSGGALDTEWLEEDVQEWFRCKDDGTGGSAQVDYEISLRCFERHGESVQGRWNAAKDNEGYWQHLGTRVARCGGEHCLHQKL